MTFDEWFVSQFPDGVWWKSDLDLSGTSKEIMERAWNAAKNDIRDDLDQEFERGYEACQLDHPWINDC